MSNRFFLDTNIFVHSFDRSSPAKRLKAEQLIRKGLTSHKGVVSYQVVQEFFNVAFKRFAEPLKRVEAEQYLATCSARCFRSTPRWPFMRRQYNYISHRDFPGTTR